MASNQGGKSASSRSSLRRIWMRMQHLFRSSRHSGKPVIDGVELLQIMDRHAAIHGALLVLAAGSMAPLDLAFITSFHSFLCVQNMLSINCNCRVTIGSMINEMINDTIVFNQQLSALEVASDPQPDQGGTPSWSFDAPEVGFRAFLHATAADPAIWRKFL